MNPAHVNDVGYRHRLTFLDPNGDPVSITGASVVFWFQAPGSEVRVQVAATVDPDQVYNKGQAYYDVTASDGVQDEEGLWLLQGQATLGGGSVLRTKVSWFQVLPVVPL